jgi:hypothetical protein
MPAAKKREPSLMILGERRQRAPGQGRRRVYDDVVSVRHEFRSTPAQAEDLRSMAVEEGRPLATIIRDAVNEYVSDYRERRIFVKPNTYQPE